MIQSETCLDKEFAYVFACDLMSDVLAMVCNDTDRLVLLTGSANNQVIRTAEMLDITTIIFVRGKTIGEAELSIAKEKQISMFATTKTMFEACGLLYQEGMTSIPQL